MPLILGFISLIWAFASSFFKGKTQLSKNQAEAVIVTATTVTSTSLPLATKESPATPLTEPASSSASSSS